MEERPGRASVQYGDARGEVAADVADQLVGLTDVARNLGFNESGRVVGMSISQGEMSPEDPDVGKVYVTFQVADKVSQRDLQQELEQNGGVLPVKEYMMSDVDIVEVLRWFKRFSIGLFTSAVKPDSLEVVEQIDVEDS